MVRVRLTRKFANSIDGVDLRKVKPGDVFDVSPDQARILIAEGWGQADENDKYTAPKRTTKTKKREQSRKRRR
jgi:hypothetical protein